MLQNAKAGQYAEDNRQTDQCLRDIQTLFSEIEIYQPHSQQWQNARHHTVKDFLNYEFLTGQGKGQRRGYLPESPS